MDALHLNADEALFLRALVNFQSQDGTTVSTGQEWMIHGPTVYHPRPEVQVISDKVQGIDVAPTQGVKLKALQDCVDRGGQPRKAGEVWVWTRHENRYYWPSPHEQYLSMVNIEFPPSPMDAIMVSSKAKRTHVVPKSPKSPLSTTITHSIKNDPPSIELEATGAAADAAATANRAAEAAKKGMFANQTWHLMSEEQILAEFQSSRRGLSVEEAARRLKENGPNMLTPPPKQHWVVKFVKMLIGGFQMMLWVAAVLCFAVFGVSKGEDIQTLVLAISLVLVVVVTGVFQFYQEGKSDNVMEALKALASTSAFVYRGGNLISVPTDSLVVGDIVKVTGGERVPADVRILEASDLKVNNAPLTGENQDIRLKPEAGHQELYEARNVARSGCNFTSGTGLAVVFFTGDKTFFGQIAASTTGIARPPSLLAREINRLVKILAVFAVLLGIIFFILAILNGFSVIEAVVFMIGIVVANVPEGLTPEVTVALTITAQRMLKWGVLVTNLEVIETLGATTVICSDKTGTLTCNRMTVSHLVYNFKIFKTPEAPVLSEDDFALFDVNNKDFKELQRVGILNTDAAFIEGRDVDVMKRAAKGDASETALIRFFDPLRQIDEYRKKCPRKVTMPFDSSKKWMASVVRGEDGDDNAYVLVKGAPERVVNMCSFILCDGEEVDFTPEKEAEFVELNESLARRGERVLAFARLRLPLDKFPLDFVFEAEENRNFPLEDLTLVGMMSLVDPPRISVRSAIAECNSAGVRVFMITGDHPVTAHAIAKSLNIISGPTKEELAAMGRQDEKCDAIVVHGQEMQGFDEKDWLRVLSHKEIVFARTMPQQKQDIVRELRKMKQVVTMTGDGVNDAPALKAAHVGIAMGSGTAVAKEASQVILLNDDFGAVVSGVREGRLIYANLKHCIAYVLASNIPQLIPFLLFIIIRIPLAIETIVILIICLGTDLAPTVALAFEEPEDAIMMVPPRASNAHLVDVKLLRESYFTIGLFETAAAMYAFINTFNHHGFSSHSLLNAGAGYRDKFVDLSDERVKFFTKMCQSNDQYLATGRNCEGEFRDFRRDILNEAQAVYLLTCVWGQIANALIRKTDVSTIFTWARMRSNRHLWESFVVEVIVVILLVYIRPIASGLNLSPPPSLLASVGLWIIPFVLAWDEGRKYLSRRALARRIRAKQQPENGDTR
eukprot:c20577_g1_i1.p1 GENE.c20577_g1_i1~~c20577_g1_i1.p1  ORF type:complete len:1182 (+),score=331.57 c20577_g1_i1:110-3655(+)